MKLVLEGPNVVCKNCGSKLFHEAVALKKVSAILSPTGKEELMPIPVFVCDKCGEIPEEYKNERNYKVIMGEAKIEDDEEASPKSSIIMP